MCWPCCSCSSTSSFKKKRREKQSSAQNAGAPCAPRQRCGKSNRVLYRRTRRGAHCAPVIGVRTKFRIAHLRKRKAKLRFPLRQETELFCIERRRPDSLSHGYAVPAPSKRELLGQVISRLSDKSRCTCRGAHCAPAFLCRICFLLNYCFSDAQSAFTALTWADRRS